MDVKQFSADKIFAHLDRVNKWLDTGFSHPITYELDMTNICNQKCPYCFGFYRRPDRSSLSLSQAKEIISQIKEFGGRGITFTGGGEPLCNPVTLDAVRYAKESGLDVGFISNGMLIDDNTAGTLLKNCTWIRVSLDAASPEVYSLSHGMDSKYFERVVENIKLLVRKKKDEIHSCTIGVGFITFSEVAKDIYPFAQLCGSLDVDYAQYRPMLKSFRQKDIDYTKEGQKKIIVEIEKSLSLSTDGYNVLYSKHKYDLMNNGQVLRNYRICYGHHFAAVVCADMKMYICCHTRGVDKYCIGDLSKMSLAEIWHSEQRGKAYQNIKLEECPPLCRCDSFNTVLWNIKQEKVHKNFL